jgi:hypothetical protein
LLRHDQVKDDEVWPGFGQQSPHLLDATRCRHHQSLGCEISLIEFSGLQVVIY